jgi:hypothetical protein
MFAGCAGGDGGSNQDADANVTDGNNGADGSNAEANANGEETVAETTRETSSLPEEMDFEGREFRIILPTPVRVYEECIVEEETGDSIIDALYKRNLRVEEKYNVTLTQTENSNPSGAVSTSIKAGDNAYELVIDTLANIRNQSSQNAFMDLYQTPYISEDLTKSWWDQALIRDLSINGKLYFQAGDIIMKDKLRIALMFFNKDMFKEMNLEFPYKYVYDGTWTIDKLSEITKDANRDINGDGVMDQYDQWGYMSQHEASFHFYGSAGEKTVTINSEGVPEITIGNPRSVEVIQKLLTVFTDGVSMFHADEIKGVSDVWITASEYFQENRFLIRSSVFEPVVRDLRAMPTDFGLVPSVKYDESQENYYAWVEVNGHYVAIPNNADAEFSGFITEALAYESGDTLKPAFYDLCLRSKVLRDDESEGMLDIIFKGKVYDIGYIYNLGQLPGFVTSLVRSKSTDFTSKYEAISASTENAVQKFIDSYASE